MGQVTYIYTYTQGNNVYIGKTKNPKSRKSKHKPRFRDWDYGIIDSVDSFSKTEWKPLESYWIEQFRQWGYSLENLNEGGSGPEGFRTEEEAKQIKKQWKLTNREKWESYVKQYNLDNKEKLVEYRKQWYLTNKEKVIERGKQYYSGNKEKLIEHSKQRYLDNPEYHKQWYLDNKEKRKQYYLDNREKIAEYYKQRYQLNKQK